MSYFGVRTKSRLIIQYCIRQMAPTAQERMSHAGTPADISSFIRSHPILYPLPLCMNCHCTALWDALRCIVILQVHNEDWTYHEYYSALTMPAPQLTTNISELYLDFYAGEGNEWEQARGFQIRYSILRDDSDGGERLQVIF